MLANRAVLALAVGMVLALGIAYGLARWRYQRHWAKQEQHDGRDRRYYRDIVALGLLLALVGGFFWRPLFNSNVTVPNGGGDLASFFYPMHVFAAASLHAGEFPLWNPHLFSGMPFAADIQSGLFYPLNWLFWLLGYPLGYEKLEGLVLLHYWLAACFSYAFARSLGLGRWPGVLAGTLYAFSGFMVAHLGHLTMLEAATWFPLVLLATNQAARRNRGVAGWRWSVTVGLFLAVSLLAGHFQLFLYNFYAALIFWIAVAWRAKVRLPALAPEVEAASLSPSTIFSITPKLAFLQNYWVRQALKGGLALLVLAGLTLVQVWPFYELGQLSVRSAISYEDSNQFGMWPVGLIDLLLPNLFSPNPQAYFGYWSNTEVLGYIGLFSFALAGLGLFLRPANRSGFYPIFFVALAIAGLIFSLAGYTIFQGWFYQFIPALNLTRGAGRLLVWFDFGLAIAAAFGLQFWLEYRARPHEPESEKVLRWGWRGLALLALALIILPLPLLYSQVLASPGNINDLVVRGINGLVLAVILLGLSATLLRLYYRRLPGPDAGAFLALALLVFDLFSARAGFNPQVGSVVNAFYHDETARFIKEQDPAGQYRLDASVGSVSQVWQANTTQLYGLNDLRGLANPLQLAGYETFWNSLTASQKDFRAVPTYNLLGARYVLARNKEDPTGPQFKLVYQDSRPGVKLNLFENSQVLPLGWLVHRSEIKPANEILLALLSPDFKPNETVYLESGRKLEGSAGPQPGEEVRLVKHSANHLQFEVMLSSEGYLLVNQAYYPGWQVQIDGGEKSRLEKANYSFGAVYLPAGKHTVNLEFAPASFGFGLIFSGISLFAVLLFLLWPLRLRLKK
jgi:hypothetical protein